MYIVQSHHHEKLNTELLLTQDCNFKDGHSNLNFSKARASVDWCWWGNVLVCVAQGLAVVFWFSSVTQDMDGSWNIQSTQKTKKILKDLLQSSTKTP